MRIHRSNLAAVGAVASEQNRYAIHGLHLDRKGRTVGTDGRMLVIVDGPKDEAEARQFRHCDEILPADLVNEVLKKMGRRRNAPTEVDLKVHRAQKQVELKIVNGSNGQTVKHSFAGRLVEGNFPRYEDVIPEGLTGAATVSLSIGALCKLLDTLYDVTRDQELATVTFTIHNDGKPVAFRTETEDKREVSGYLMPVTLRD